VASDFDKLFPDDGFPFDSDSERMRGSGRHEDGPGRNPFEPFVSQPGAENFTTENENRAPRVLNEKEVKITGVFVEDPGAHPQHFVYLKDNRGRRVRIYVGQFEAFAITMALEGPTPVRPMTHDLVKLMVDRLDAKIERVIIDDLWNETFYAKIGLLTSSGVSLDIDCRPSDAIALAVRARVPIYMAESVLEATTQE
jgi:bifunctional DNase/RNase